MAEKKINVFKESAQETIRVDRHNLNMYSEYGKNKFEMNKANKICKFHAKKKLFFPTKFF